MFRHRGKSRTLHHNLKLASSLSFVAGMVNVSGLFALNILTTNVTGHFAFLADEMARKNAGQMLLYLSFILSFLFGAFCSSLLVEFMAKINQRYAITLPVGIECLILFWTGFTGDKTVSLHADLIACFLLFSMGLQNALVTSLSNSVVRTTHLTGLFTDLGIELSQLFFHKPASVRKQLRSSIKLRLTIILFFFLGGILGGFGYLFIGIKVLSLAGAVLLAAVAYDTIKYRVTIIKRRYLS